MCCRYKKWSCVIGTALLPDDMDDFTICWMYKQ